MGRSGPTSEDSVDTFDDAILKSFDGLSCLSSLLLMGRLVMVFEELRYLLAYCQE